MKKQTSGLVIYALLVRLFLAAGFLLAFALGLVVAWSEPGAVLPLVVLVAVVSLALGVQGFRLWYALRCEDARRLARASRRAARKEVAQ